MIVRNESTLVVLGYDGRTAAAVTERTGLAPTRATEAGPRPEGGPPRPYSVWHRAVESRPDDESGFGSLRELLDDLLPAAGSIRALAPEYDARISWGGFSDSGQGGFVLEPDVARALGSLGLPVHGTVYLG